MKVSFDINMRSKKPIMLTIEEGDMRVNIDIDDFKADEIASILSFAIQDYHKQKQEYESRA